jgi:two-component system, cell cycle response regulator DivK
VVEDEPDGQEVVRGILDYFDITADAVASAEDALRLLRQNHYAAVVIDLALPGMDGIELLAAIRDQSETASLPCIAVTAFHTSAVKRQVLEAGFDAYLPKPIDDTTFVRTLDSILSRG